MIKPEPRLFSVYSWGPPKGEPKGPPNPGKLSKKSGGRPGISGVGMPKKCSKIGLLPPCTVLVVLMLTTEGAAVLASCVTGEEAAVVAYDSALKSDHLTPDLRQLLTEHLNVIRGSLSEIIALRDALK